MPRPRWAKPALHLHIDFAKERSLGPISVRLLELIEETGSISAAGRALGIAYHPAWDLIDELNRPFDKPLVTTQTGGTNGGGAKLTKVGFTVIRVYREMEKNAGNVTSKGLGNLTRLLGVTTAEGQQPPRVKRGDDLTKIRSRTTVASITRK